MDSEGIFSLYLAVLAIVVVELTASVRGSETVQEVWENDEKQRYNTSFRFGRLPWIHFTCCYLLGIGIQLGLPRENTGAAVGGLMILLVFLPFLEVDQYDHLLRGDGLSARERFSVQSSFYSHAFVTLIWSVSLYYFPHESVLPVGLFAMGDTLIFHWSLWNDFQNYHDKVD